MADPVSARPENADQVAFWNGDAGERWAANQAFFDRLLAPVNGALLAAAKLMPGQTVLDIGCGCGATSFAAAEAVGSGGQVVGVDISGPMLAIARESTKRTRTAPQFVLADAAHHRFAPGRFDRALSRFGVMFFADPPLAFANIRGGMKPGARLAFLCWQEMKANPWLATPLFAALPHVPPPPPVDPLGPGPFAFADRDRVWRLLTEAGFAAIEIAAQSFTFTMGQAGPGALDEAVSLAADIGPASAIMKDAGPEAQAKARQAIRAVLEPLVSPTGIQLPGACWLVAARA